MKNYLIVFDGMDGTGKSTQISKLHDYLFKRDKRIRILTTREPTFGRYGKKIRAILKDNNDPYSDSDLLLDMFVQDRKEHLDQVIKPFLKKRDENISIVLCDRYYYSNIAYQHAQGVPIKKAIEMNKKFLRPDLAIILDLFPETALKRISSERKVEKFEKLEFMQNLRNNFHELKRILPDNIQFIDTSGNESETFEKIRRITEKMLRKTGFHKSNKEKAH